MLLCYICKCEVQGGWVYGFPPSADSFKLALCSEHNTGSNQQKVVAAWQDLMTASITGASQRVGKENSGGILFNVSIEFKTNTTRTYPCYSCVVTPQNTLRLHRQSGKFTYFPMTDIKAYTIMPHDPTEK